MGSTTYEWILDHEFAGKDPAEWKWPYEIPCWVFTHRQLPIVSGAPIDFTSADRSEEHTSELQSRSDLVCRLLLEKKKNNTKHREREELICKYRLSSKTAIVRLSYQ